MARAPQPAGDLPLTDPRAVPPAGPVALGFEDPGEQEDGQEQQGQGPGREAGDGHGEKCCGDREGAAPAPLDGGQATTNLAQWAKIRELCHPPTTHAPAPVHRTGLKGL